jgi:hypothetical protein
VAPLKSAARTLLEPESPAFMLFFCYHFDINYPWHAAASQDGMTRPTRRGAEIMWFCCKQAALGWRIFLIISL